MSDSAPTVRNDRRNILLLGLVSFINDTSSKIILPVLPLFLAHLGAAGAAIGIISGISDSVAGLLKMFAGYWSDRTGRRLDHPAGRQQGLEDRDLRPARTHQSRGRQTGHHGTAPRRRHHGPRSPRRHGQ